MDIASLFWRLTWVQQKVQEAMRPALTAPSPIQGVAEERGWPQISLTAAEAFMKSCEQASRNVDAVARHERAAGASNSHQPAAML